MTMPRKSISDSTFVLPWNGAAERRLIETILQPVHGDLPLKKRAPLRGECSFPAGLRILGNFPDEKGLLDTARADFEAFFHAWHLESPAAAPCRLIHTPALEPEEHRIKVSLKGVEIRASDTEGIRRALIWIEDEMLKREGPLLPMGTHRRKAMIRTRISRCFFGPINRPPASRDELADDFDYYPEHYLSRLAHDGVNVLWITIRFRNTVPSRIFPEFAPESPRRLAKLQTTVDRCARYGIRVFVFCIEPDSLPLDSPIFVRHPELKGHVIDFRAAFCTSSKIGKAYLAEAAKTLFSNISGLGGMIVIPVGERFTQCSSIALPESGTTEERCNCPRCAHRDPCDVLYDTLAALRRGMNAANPSAELISWPYGQLIMWGDRMTLASATRVPKGVVLQHNFETGGIHRQLGKSRPLYDYWLSVVGPSPIFREAARVSRAKGINISAKLQVGCSHENATVPFVPVPGLLYAKYRILHDLGVSGVMQSWYFGNYPSLMTRAAGLLSFAPFPTNESEFLRALALRDWPRHAAPVVRAWKLFRRSYENYPATHLFGYYGPVQDGLVWPLHLIPQNRPLSPTWKLGYPPSGDYLADCLSSEFALREVVTLCRRMAQLWQRGLRHLGKAYAASSKTETQQREWDVARAIGLQFDSAADILRFYQLRETLVEANGRSALRPLDEMKNIVQKEITRRCAMIDLCQAEPTVGFHSEAEGFKITPALLRRGIRSLESLLKKEFPTVQHALSQRIPLFSKYTGHGAPLLIFKAVSPADSTIRWHSLRYLLTQNSAIRGKPISNTIWQKSPLKNSPIRARFQARAISNALHISIIADTTGQQPVPHFLNPWISSIIIDVEPGRLHPRIQFSADTRHLKTSLIDDGYLMKKQLPFEVKWELQPDGWQSTILIPFQSARLSKKTDLFRFNIRVVAFNQSTDERLELSWSNRTPLQARQAWDDANPAKDYDWAKIEP